MKFERFVAVDWSGAKDNASQRKKIWVADFGRVGSGRFVDPQMTRDEVCRWLKEQVKPGPPALVGLDFAFSFPEEFVREKALGSAPELWRLADEATIEGWLKSDPRFWGHRNGARTNPKLRHTTTRKTDDDNRFRVGSAAPTSVFKLVGPTQVGKGALRGFKCLAELRDCGFAIWPFDQGSDHTIVEIYPRFFSQAVVKSNREALKAHLLGPEFKDVSHDLLTLACQSDDAFDALVSAIAMRKLDPDVHSLARAADAATQSEGQIWPRAAAN